MADPLTSHPPHSTPWRVGTRPERRAAARAPAVETVSAAPAEQGGVGFAVADEARVDGEGMAGGADARDRGLGRCSQSRRGRSRRASPGRWISPRKDRRVPPPSCALGRVDQLTGGVRTGALRHPLFALTTTFAASACATTGGVRRPVVSGTRRLAVSVGGSWRCQAPTIRVLSPQRIQRCTRVEGRRSRRPWGEDRT